MHVNAIDGVDCVDPSSPLVRADGNGLGNGWANNPQFEAQIAAWYNATSLDEEKTIVRQLNRLAVESCQERDHQADSTVSLRQYAPQESLLAPSHRRPPPEPHDSCLRQTDRSCRRAHAFDEELPQQ
jgi:hypothetical protein